MLGNKGELYSELLNLKNPTDNEIHIMYYLSIDEDVQKVIRTNIDILKPLAKRECPECSGQLEPDCAGIYRCTACEWVGYI